MIIMILIAVLVGCGTDKVTSPTAVSPAFIPLKVGNQWTYEEVHLDSAGNTHRIDTMVQEISRDTLINGEKWYILTINGAVDPEIGPITIRRDGMWAGGPSGSLQFKYPASVNDTFMMGNQLSIVESICDTITVPAGVFICHNYKWPEEPASPRPYQYHYLSPGVGFIKAEEFYKTQSGYIYINIRTELISYILK